MLGQQRSKGAVPDQKAEGSGDCFCRQSPLLAKATEGSAQSLGPEHGRGPMVDIEAQLRHTLGSAVFSLFLSNT